MASLLIYKAEKSYLKIVIEKLFHRGWYGCEKFNYFHQA
jgi:hypothetical protein